MRWAVEGAQLLLESNRQLEKSNAQKAKIESLLSESDSLSNFVGQMLNEAPDCNVTTAELLEAYKGFCETNGWTPVSIRFATHMFPELIFMRFGISKRTDILRHGKNQRGYYGLAINS